MPLVIRQACQDGSVLQEIERLAGERIGDVGLPDVADHEPPSVESLARYASAGRGWVAIDNVGLPIGYVLIDVVDGNAHIEQASVKPDHQGVGVGRSLIEHVSAWAVEAGISAVTLTTFTDVSWNAPLYRHLGATWASEPRPSRDRT